MDKMQIETEAVNKVKTRVNLTRYLSSYLSENDKTPTWDGAIYIYNSEEKTKKNLFGRLPAQVKGHETNDFSKDEISYNLEISDLRNFHNDMGCILFVTYLNPNDDQTDFNYMIYYAELTPVRLSAILSECPDEQQTVSIHLKRLPSKPDDFASLIRNCFDNCKRQASFSGTELPTIQELEKQGNIESIQAFVSGYGEEYKDFRGFLKLDTPLYVRIKGTAIPQPVKYQGETVYKEITRIIPGGVVSGGKTFYSEYIVKDTSEEESVVHIGHGFTMTLKHGDHTCRVNYKAPHMLRQFVEDAPFLLAFAETKQCVVNGAPFDFSASGFESTNIDLEKYRKDYTRLARYVEMLEKQGCKEDVDYTQLNSVDWRNMERLAQSTLEEKPIYGLQSDLPPIVSMKVGPLIFAVGLIPVENVPGAYYMCHFQELKDIVVFIPSMENRVPAPSISLLNAENYASISNIRFEQILSSIKEYPINESLCTIANNSMLQMILAADKTEGNRKKVLLSTALNIAEWLMTISNDVWDEKIAIVNRLQIIIRERALTEDERRILYDLIVTSSDRKDILFAANALIGQKDIAKGHFASFSPEEQNEIKKYPIYRFVGE